MMTQPYLANCLGLVLVFAGRVCLGGLEAGTVPAASTLDVVRLKQDLVHFLSDPGGLEVRSIGGMTEVVYTPDNTGYSFTVPQGTRLDTLATIVKLYVFFCASDFGIEVRMAARSPDVERLVGKVARTECSSKDWRQAGVCALRRLAADSKLRVSFVRYDEGGRAEIPVDLNKRLSSVGTAR